MQILPNKPRYQPGDLATYKISTRTPDKKPVQAEVSLGVVDEAIYAIAPDSTPNIVSYFYPKRAMEVQTAYSFPDIYLSGDDKAGATIRTRTNFPDTAFWAPTVITDAQGQATLSFTLPDNLTTWRATARAATLDTRVGQATAKVIVQKPFLLRLETPRFFTQGDQVSVVAVAHNLTANPLAATVGIEGHGVEFGQVKPQHILLGAGQTQRLEWSATAPTSGSATVRVWGKAGDLTDAMALTLPVLPRGRRTEETRAGTMMGNTDLRFELRKDAIPGTPRLTLRLAPSLAGAMLGALDYLASYPYGCVEQTMSSFLPDIIVADLLKQRGLDKAALRKKLPSMVNAGLLKLYGFQHADKAWGWWQYDQSDPWMTAYVVYGLQRAKEAGFTVNEGVLQDGIISLMPIAEITDNTAPQHKTGIWSNVDPDTRAYVAYVLAVVGQRDGEAAGKIVDNFSGPQHEKERAALSDWGRLTLARAEGLLGRTEAGHALLEAEWTRFNNQQLKETGSGWRWWSETDVAAALLAAGVELSPQDPRLPDLVRWLLEHRQDNHWMSTRDTAAVLDALSSYLRVSKELQPDLQVNVVVNGKPAFTKHFTSADLFQPEQQLSLDAAALGTDAADVRIISAGSGRLYYTATLAQVVTSGLLAPVYNNSGLQIERRYRKITLGTADTTPADNAPSQTVFHTGDVIEVTLTLRSQRHAEFLLVEDPLPAGCEARDRGVLDMDEWSDWWCDQITRDQSVSFALRQLDPGVRRITYRIFALVPGQFTALPPRIFDMYHPEIFGSGPADTITIRP